MLVHLGTFDLHLTLGEEFVATERVTTHCRSDPVGFVTRVEGNLLGCHCADGFVRTLNDDCVPCQRGTYELSHSTCWPASSGYYVPQPGSNISGRFGCPVNTRVLRRQGIEMKENHIGQNRSECVCQPGYFAPNAADPQACEE
eukprot:5264716-Prymnesium_polylepis.1